MQLTVVHESHWERVSGPLWRLRILDYLAEIDVAADGCQWTVFGFTYGNVLGTDFADSKDDAMHAAEQFITDHHAQTAQG